MIEHDAAVTLDVIIQFGGGSGTILENDEHIDLE